MSKIARKYQKVFGGSADVSLFNQFGSAALGSPVATKDLDVIQGLNAFLNGFTQETVGDWIPVLEDFNALEFMYTTQLAYIFQAGVSEWDAATTYYIGSFCQVGGFIYKSLTEANQGNAVTNPTYWVLYDTNPIGTILTFISKTPPVGYLYCDGSAVSRTTYANLFAKIGVEFGYGDNSTTFNLPDLRGRFIRGMDDGQGNDPDAAIRTAMATGGNTGDNVGSVQADQNKEHSHICSATPKGTENGVPQVNGDENFPFSPAIVFQSGSGGSEARPKNVNMAYHIKY